MWAATMTPNDSMRSSVTGGPDLSVVSGRSHPVRITPGFSEQLTIDNWPLTSRQQPIRPHSLPFQARPESLGILDAALMAAQTSQVAG